METIFWICLTGGFYAYVGYPLLLKVLGGFFARDVNVSPRGDEDLPAVTVLMPVHNEAAVLEAKLNNLLALDYPSDKLDILVVSDGSSDDSVAIAKRFAAQGPVRVIETTERKGKANALNTGLAELRHDIVVFTDASIMLEPQALKAIVAPFADPEVGCVSGEDVIPESGGEALYGRYELWLRRQESRLHSLVGASGSFYAQRRSLCRDFPEGVAPDFLSVLNTVREGYRAISVEQARGEMGAVKSHSQEFQRKVRTLIRGMAALWQNADLLNPAGYPWFSLALWSHKIGRWLVPFFMLGALIANLVIVREHTFYQFTALLQVVFYTFAVLGMAGQRWVESTLLGKAAIYLVNVNAAVLVAWIKYFSGTRQEIWNPSKR